MASMQLGRKCPSFLFYNLRLLTFNIRRTSLITPVLSKYHSTTFNNATFRKHSICSNSTDLIFSRLYCTNDVGTQETSEVEEEQEEEEIKLHEKFYNKFGVEHATATETLASLNADDAKRLKVLKLEYDVFFSDGTRVPDVVTDAMFLEILRKPSVSSRRKTYAFWFKREKMAMSDIRKKIVRARSRDKHLASIEGEDRPCNNTIFLKIHSTRFSQWAMHKFIHAFQTGPRLVLDLGFHQHMTPQEQRSLVDQVLRSHGINKFAQEPFHLYLSNAKPDNDVMRLLRKRETKVLTEDYMWDVCPDDVTQMFDRDEIIYLSPDAPQEMEEFEHDKVYVIGALVDTSNSAPVTLAKGKRDKLQLRRLPLDKYVKWKQGGKSLTIDQMMQIMMNIKDSGDWSETLLNCIPKRKLDLNYMEEARRSGAPQADPRRDKHGKAWDRPRPAMTFDKSLSRRSASRDEEWRHPKPNRKSY